MYGILGSSGKVYGLFDDFFEALEAYDGPNSVVTDDDIVLKNMDILYNDEEARAAFLANPISVDSMAQELIKLGYSIPTGK